MEKPSLGRQENEMGFGYTIVTTVRYIVTVKAWLCRLCGHKWIVADEARIPEKCAKCRKRNWS